MIAPLNHAPLVALALCLASSYAAQAAEDSTCHLNMFAQMPVEMQHMRATVPVTINGTPTRIWLDSGAFYSIMPEARAAELGLKTWDPPFGLRVNAIGGSFVAKMTIVRDFGFLGVTLHHVDFLVGGSDAGNAFLGANFLGRWTTEFDLGKGKVAFFDEVGCEHTNLAYWNAGTVVGVARLLPGRNPDDRHIHVEVVINGQPLRAALDTGAPYSSLSKTAAERVGIDLKGPDTVASAPVGGAGASLRQSWIARTRTIDIGGELIKNSPIRVIDDSGDGVTDMLLGADFLLSHHVLVSQGQHKVYVTYSGGPVFSIGTEKEIGPFETRGVNMGTAEKAADPRTADEFAGRGSARLARGDHDGAIADYSEAIRLNPQSADLLASRAEAYQQAGKLDLVRKDLDTALAITPNDRRLLLRRATLRLDKGDRAGALADTNAAAAALPRGSLDAVPVVTLYENLGQADRGLALLDPVIELHSSDMSYGQLLNARNWNRALAGVDLDRVLKDADFAIRKIGPVPQLLNTRALVQLRRKTYAAVIIDTDAALAKQPKLAVSLYFRGLAELAGGKATAGAADIAAARALQPAIDTRFAPYGLAAPDAAPAQPGGGSPSHQ